MSNNMELACSTAEEFSQIYYKSMDKSRHQVGKLYTDTGLLDWCGHGYVTPEKIQTFLLSIPATEFTISSLDAQPVADDLASSQTILVQVSGQVKYINTESGGKEPREKSFFQTFMITAQGDKWKIVSDCFRLQGTLNKS